MPDIQNPHDKFFKETFSHPDVAQDFLHQYLPQNVRERMDLTTLALTKDSFVDRSLQEQFSDLLFTVQVKNDEHLYIYLLFEHKSYPEPLIAFHLLRYMVKIWEHDIKEEQKTLRPIIPLVIYHGEPVWNASLEFGGLFPPGEEWSPYTPQFRYLLYDIPRFREEDVKGEAHLQVYLLLMKYIFHRDLKRHLGQILERFQALPAHKNMLDLISVVIHYLLNATDAISYQDLVLEVENSLKEKGKNAMPTIAEQLRQEGKQEGKQEGRQEGRQEGKLEGILEVLKFRFGAVPSEWIPRFEAIHDTEQLNQLMRLALAASSQEDFQKQSVGIGIPL